MSNELSIKARENGPFVVTLKGAGNPVYLCRCGCSEKKPYCDGAHIKCGFEAEEKELGLLVGEQDETKQKDR